LLLEGIYTLWRLTQQRKFQLNKAELIGAISGKTGQTKFTSEQVLNALIEVVTETVAAGDSVQLVGFGTFKSSHRTGRAGRNPQTGAALNIPATTVPKFTAGEGFKKKVAEAAGKAQ